MERISELSGELEKEKKRLDSIQEQLDKEKSIVVPEEKELDVVLPNIRLVSSEIAFLKNKIKTLKDAREEMEFQLQEQLNPNTWPVKNTFEECKERIAREMKKLLNYLDKPEKDVSINNEKTPNPLGLIEAY